MKRRWLLGAVVGLLSGSWLGVGWLVGNKPGLYDGVAFSSAVFARNGELLRLQLAADERYRLRVSLADVAPAAVEATLLYEDQHFYRHPGVNPVALLRAGWHTYVRGGRVMGASTISMQVARLRFRLHSRTPAGKLQQIARALQLEWHYSKDEILEAYLNLAPYGGNVEGLGAAALIYFDKPAAQLNLAQALALAVVPQNPNRRRPSRAAGLAALTEARSRLFDRWQARHGSSASARAQLALPLSVRAPGQLPYRAPHFSRELLTSTRLPGPIYSTLDWPLQRLLEGRLQDYLARQAHRGLNNASALLVDARSLQVLAAVGSADFNAAQLAGQVDGTRAKRSPGSTLKPLLYAQALDEGLIHPQTLLHDAPRRFAAYTPENFDRGFMGPISAEDALIYSRNVPAIELLTRVGQDRFHRLLQRGGVKGLRDAGHYGLAMVLGGNELTMVELTALYTALANGGGLRPLQTVTAAPAAPHTRLFSPEASFLTLDMLRRTPLPADFVSSGIQRRTPIAWKTGTSYAYRDAWTIGVIGPYVLAVWIGNFDGSSNPALIGRSAAAPLLFEIAAALPISSQERQWGMVPGADLNLARVEVCQGTGGLPGRHCPRTESTWFIPGVSPITVSSVHRLVHVDRASGLRACTDVPGKTDAQVFEFWPSDIQTLRRQAGIAARQPPSWHPDCAVGVTANDGNAPEIFTPAARLTYVQRLADERPQPIALQARVDAGVKSVYWFVDDAFIGRATPQEPVLWEPRLGDQRLLVVDDAGRSHSRVLTVVAAPARHSLKSAALKALPSPSR